MQTSPVITPATIGAATTAAVAAAQATADTALAAANEADDTADAASALAATKQASSAVLTTLAANGTPTVLGLANLIEGAPVIDPATPYSPAVATKQIIRSTSGTINLDSTGRTPGDRIDVIASGAIDVSGDPQNADTLDGGSSTVTVSLVAGQQVSFLLQSATAWRSVQPVASSSGPPGGYVGTPDTVFCFGNEPLAISESSWYSFPGGTFTQVA